MMSRIRRNAVYNVLLFTPRKLRVMSAERVKSMIPNRETRRRQAEEMMGQGGSGSSAPPPALRTVNLARLSVNVRQLLDARESMKELALASFSELKDSFARAGLLTRGDQLRWASACIEFELLEDDLAEEIYIGLKGRTGAAPTSEAAAPLDKAAQEEQLARQAFREALENEEFLQGVTNFSTRPEEFLAKMCESAIQQGWTNDDVAKMRQMYRAAGIDLDEMLQQMAESADQLPPAQREVVEFMRKMLESPEEIEAEAKSLVEEGAACKVKV